MASHILQCSYNELKIAPEEQPLLMTQSGFESRAQHEKTFQIMMETFNIPAFFTEDPGVLSSYSSGHTTGIVIDLGHGSTTFTPMYEGYMVPAGRARLEIGGQDITEYMRSLLSNNSSFTSGSHILNTNVERSIVGDIKEKFGYTCLDFDSEMATFASSSSSLKKKII